MLSLCDVNAATLMMLFLMFKVSLHVVTMHPAGSLGQLAGTAFI